MLKSIKSKAAVAGVLAIGLIAAGAPAAMAAPLPPLPNGSTSPFYIMDETTAFIPDNTVHQWEDFILGNPNNVTPGDAFVGTPDATGAAVFLSTPGQERNIAGYIGTNGSAYAEGTFNITYPNISLFQLDGANIGSVKANGGDFSLGIVHTKGNGVLVADAGVMFASIHVNPGGTWTYVATKAEVVPANVIVEADLTAPENATLATTLDSTVVAIDAGAANAGKTLDVAAFQAGTRVELGSVVFGASGTASVDVAGKGFAAHQPYKLFAYDHNALDEVLAAWGTFTLTVTPPLYPLSFDSNLSATVTASNRFELVAPANLNVNLGDVRRNKTTTPVELGQFSVFDDRDELKGWDVNVTAGTFTGPNGKTIANTALGYVGVQDGGIQDGVSVTAGKAAGEGAFGTLFSGAPESSTTEEGAHFNADLTFKAPIDSVKGTYNSTLTMTLVSK